MWLQLAFERVLMAIAYSVFQIRDEVKGVERQFIVISWMPCVDRQRILVNANPIDVYKHCSRIYRKLQRNGSPWKIGFDEFTERSSLPLLRAISCTRCREEKLLQREGLKCIGKYYTSFAIVFFGCSHINNDFLRERRSWKTVIRLFGIVLNRNESSRMEFPPGLQCSFRL